ncbi:MAG: mechanosensitive ion channel family protein [Alphaproteobacteria bacterium]|nr:MAG: mechanosensitive ion channel family protein [Alphaproteobacteria bacterium]
MIETYGPMLASMGLDLIAAILTLIVGLWLAGWAKRLIARLLERSGRVDLTLTTFLGSLARYLIIAFTVLAILSRFGVQTASVIAVLGALGLAVGLALQGTLADVAAGVLLLFFRPFKVGDFVDVGGIAGSVRAIDLFTTELATPDNRKILVPNGKIWGNPITNFSANDTRRVDLTFSIGYDDDIDKALAVLRDCVAADGRCHKEPAPAFVVSALADSAVNLTIRVWTATSDFWDVHFDMLKTVKQRFDAEGITIPYPHVFQINKTID